VLSRILGLSLFFILSCTAFADDTLQALTYDFTLRGLDHASIEKRFNMVSSLISYKSSPVYSSQTLNKRINDDYEALIHLLESKGYYDLQISLALNEKNHHAEIGFDVATGQRYKIKKITIDLGAAHDDVLAVYPFLFENLPIQTGDAVSVYKIQETFGIITEHFSNCGYPYAKIKDHTVELLRDNKRIILVIRVDPGPKSYFGEINVENHLDVPESYVKNRAPWDIGDVFDHRKIERYREKLSRTRLFDSIVLDYPKESSAEGYVPLTVAATERKARTLSAGLRYSLNEKFGATAGWTHRNLTSKADRLRTELTVGQLKSKLGVDYEVPDFIWVKKTLTPSIELSREDTESYVSQSMGGSLLLRTEFAENSDYFYGVSLEHDRARKHHKTKTGNLVGLPLGVKYDVRDDLFDPSKGYFFNASFTPKVGRIGKSHMMTKTIVSGAYYYAVAPKLIIAGWGRAGSIAGINYSDVVANELFYAGGGGSVRGYGYQMAGPLDKSYDPTGGKSLIEAGLECRVRVLENWGGALFIEGAQVNKNSLPDSHGKTLYGAGAGIRYFTDFGPIRADIAVPLERRTKKNGKYVDQILQFYISIGQGF
jgi:translocation and assembly module TamA